MLYYVTNGIKYDHILFTCRTEATTIVLLYISRPRGCESNFTAEVSAYAFVVISIDLNVSSIPAV